MSADGASVESRERGRGLFRRKTRSRSQSYDSESDDNSAEAPRRRRLWSKSETSSIDDSQEPSRGRRFKNIGKKISGMTRRARSLSNDAGKEGRRNRFARGRNDNGLPDTINLEIGTSTHSNQSETPRKGIRGGRRTRSLDEMLPPPGKGPARVSFGGEPSMSNDDEEDDGMLALFKKQQERKQLELENTTTVQTPPKRPGMERMGSGLMSSVHSDVDRSTLSSQSGTRARYDSGDGGRQKKFRVKPHHCFPEPVSLTEEEIYQNSLEPSRDFEKVQSFLVPFSKNMRTTPVDEIIKNKFGTPARDGRIGSLRVELLGCIGINRTKPDLAAYFVCGDSAFCSDVVSGYRSPMWPCVSKRAALFPIHHAYAKLYVGIFDVKARKNKENDVFCGRVVLDLAPLRPDTEFDVTFPLRSSALVYDRKKRGVVRLRFSLHWFSERAAIMSYLDDPKTLIKNQPLTSGYPSIPCADPKTYRNVAVTTYGEDLPGKYSKNSFRAVVREFNLYNQNLRAWIKNLGYDTVLYERPLRSIYLFLAGMHCVYMGSVRLVPAILVGFILILYYQSYLHYVEKDGFNLGYKPVTLLEMLRALVTNTSEQNFKAIAVSKLAKQRKRQEKAQLRRVGSDADQDDARVDANMDHREFPFAEKDAYPRFTVEEGIHPGKSKGGNQRLHGRLSVYYSKSDDDQDAEDGGNDDEFSSGDESEGDDETVATEGNMGDDIYDDLDDEENEGLGQDEENVDLQFDLSAASTPTKNPVELILRQGAKSKARRIRVGPPQNSEASSGGKVAPQVQLKRMENIMHKFTRKISVEPVHAPVVEMVNGKPVARRASLVVTTEAIEQQEKDKKKAVYDEFDKLLGMHNFGSNPITRITATFLGPMMRIIRILTYIARITFNTTTWRDPMLSFWVFAFLSALCLTLIIFPWRLFFGLCVVGSVGPQNLLVRLYLERKAAKKIRDGEEAKKKAKEEDPYGYGYATNGNDDYGYGETHVPTKSAPSPAPEAPRRNTTRRHRKANTGDVDPSLLVTSRPPFSSEFHGNQSSSKKQLEPRSIVIPYSRLKKDRFYFWPPDPTVSKATPLSWLTEVAQSDDVSEISLSEDIAESPPTATMSGAGEGLRRRGGNRPRSLSRDKSTVKRGGRLRDDF